MFGVRKLCPKANLKNHKNIHPGITMIIAMFVVNNFLGGVATGYASHMKMHASVKNHECDVLRRVFHSKRYSQDAHQ